MEAGLRLPATNPDGGDGPGLPRRSARVSAGFLSGLRRPPADWLREPTTMLQLESLASGDVSRRDPQRYGDAPCRGSYRASHHCSATQDAGLGSSAADDHPLDPGASSRLHRSNTWSPRSHVAERCPPTRADPLSHRLLRVPAQACRTSREVARFDGCPNGLVPSAHAAPRRPTTSWLAIRRHRRLAEC